MYTREEHIARHKELHKALDELVADWIVHTKGRPNEGTIMDLIVWSHTQTKNPSPDME